MEHVRAHVMAAWHEDGVLAAWRAAAALLDAVLRLATTGLETDARPITARRGVQSLRLGVQTRLVQLD
jgi:hypothetical protein